MIPDSLEGMKHFVEAYHQNAQDEVPLKFHGGGVQQAINLEFCGEDAYSAVGFMFGESESSFVTPSSKIAH